MPHPPVRETRKLRRAWDRDRHPNAWYAYVKWCARKKKIISKAKRTEFRRAVAEAAESQEGVWKLAKWAREKRDKPKEIPRMPTLKEGDRVATSFEEKIDAQGRFFPPRTLT